MKLNKLLLKDKPTFNRYLGLAEHSLSVYAFTNIYIWKSLFDIRWANIDGNLCIFFHDPGGCFLYLEPLAKRKSPRAIEEAFKIMDGFNRNREVSRIENVEEKDLSFYRALGYEVCEKSCDYVSLRDELVGLAGNKFKSKRASVNYFLKNNVFQYLPFSARDELACLVLYQHWAKERRREKDNFYQGLLSDSCRALSVLLKNFRRLDVLGRVVRIDGKIRAFTFGFCLNRNTFCILYEVCDLSFKGIAQFIFREFCRELKGYTYINVMDDSGLENLKKVKLSYQPLNLVPAYIVKRQSP